MNNNAIYYYYYYFISIIIPQHARYVSHLMHGILWNVARVLYNVCVVMGGCVNPMFDMIIFYVTNNLCH